MYSFRARRRADHRQHDHVIEALAPDRSNEPLNVGVLPRRARRGQDFQSSDRLQVIERMIPIVEDILRQVVPRERVSKLLYGPCGRGMLRDGNMHDASTVVGEEHQNEQQPARDCRDDEEVGRD
jgi:hypothetical protein